MKMDAATVARIAKAYSAINDLVDSGELDGLKEDVEALGQKIVAKIGPKADGTHYTLAEIQAITNEGRTNFAEAIERSRDTE